MRLWAALLGLAGLAAAAWGLWPTTPIETQSVEHRAAQLDQDTRAPRLSAQVISNEDLPPEGTRSLFDHLIAQNDGLPYPFEKLVELITAQSPDSQPPVTVFIPFGRSLLKAQADLAHPRVLVAGDVQAPNTDANLGPILRGQLFLGFVENANEIEVISYNEAAGRFEFQLVQDYSETGARRIVYARRAVCLTCHQSHAPIFPQRPWNETNGQPQQAEAIVAARGSDAPYLGAPIRQPLAAPERFDELTEVASYIALTQQLWIDGCGEGQAGAECRRQILRVALSYRYDPGNFDPHGEAAQKLKALQARAWPAEGIAVADVDLLNRDPLAERRGLGHWWARLFASDSITTTGARNNEDLSAFDQLPKLPRDLDPLTPRPPRRLLAATDLEAAYGIAALITDDDLQGLMRGAGHDDARLLGAADALAEGHFAPVPYSRVRMLQALHEQLQSGTATVPAYCCLDTSEMSPPLALGVPPLELSADSPLRPFAEYCFSCHRGNPSARLNFMAGDDEAAVAERIRATAAIRDVLDWERYQGTDKESTLMPPADSPQRTHLRSALQQQPQLLQKMREQVPGLFDF